MRSFRSAADAGTCTRIRRSTPVVVDLHISIHCWSNALVGEIGHAAQHVVCKGIVLSIGAHPRRLACLVVVECKPAGVGWSALGIRGRRWIAIGPLRAFRQSALFVVLEARLAI